MSVVCTVLGAGATYVGATTLIGLASAAATALGLRQLQAAEAETAREEARDAVARCAAEAQSAIEQVELSTSRSAALSALVAERCQAVFGDATFQLVLSRDVRGQLTVRAHGEGMGREEVAARAERFLGLLQQQLAYREVLLGMRAHGLVVQEESRTEDGTVKVRLARG